MPVNVLVSSQGSANGSRYKKAYVPQTPRGHPFHQLAFFEDGGIVIIRIRGPVLIDREAVSCHGHATLVATVGEAAPVTVVLGAA